MTPGPDVTDEPASLDEFLEWIQRTLGLPAPPQASTRLDQILGDDALARFLLVHAFDELTKGDASPIATIYMLDSARDLYLHYLEVLSRPMED